MSEDEVALTYWANLLMRPGTRLDVECDCPASGGWYVSREVLSRDGTVYRSAGRPAT